MGERKKIKKIFSKYSVYIHTLESHDLNSVT